MGKYPTLPLHEAAATGAQLLHSGDAIPDFLTVWTAVALILFNLNRFSAQPLLHPWWFLGLVVMLPVAVLGGLYQWQRRRQQHIVSEADEVRGGVESKKQDAKEGSNNEMHEM